MNKFITLIDVSITNAVLAFGLALMLGLVVMLAVIVGGYVGLTIVGIEIHPQYFANHIMGIFGILFLMVFALLMHLSEDLKTKTILC